MTQESLKQLIKYDKDTGKIERLDRKNSNGSIDSYGYLIIKIKGKQYKAHRLAWLYEYGEFPSGNIDHINSNRTDNRIENLQDISQEINCKERIYEPNKDTAEFGIYYDKCTKGLLKKYSLKDGKKTWRFKTIEEALRKREEVDIKRNIKRRQIEIK